ncbi:katanin p80 WD40 repeat-containing subunit B1 [Anopheles aquasalis]|uniref:katanin p80 WD40 repeat-containing subunit B1 n=1 Tax=Anopheles aquasalis TaxID=42839 RepID=UPI00215A6954|nr:katanin p80 WD40 repeat-containing subunit B1 [Anopheles aquasalis]
MLPSVIYDIQAHSSKVTCLNLGETGRVLVTGGQDRNIKLWAFSSKQCSMTLQGHNSSIECVKFAYSDDFVFSADDTGVIKLWNLNVGESTSLYGHMKSVRTLDVYPMNDNYAVSGSNDTTIRLWDIREKQCVKRYRGHMSHVNSVKFSPDGLWIASAGHEGSVIIWDIRMSSKFREFSERPTHATFVQYHPSDLLMAAGRHDGTVDLYDLEQFKLLTRTMPTSAATPASSNGQPVRCVTFDESGKVLFVGTAAGITAIGWEPDQEFDRIELNAGDPAAPWQLGDMHNAGQELLYGTYEGGVVAIHAVPFSRLGALRVAPSNTNQTFTYNHSSRKSFNRGSGKLRLSIGVDRMGTASGSGSDGNTAGSATANLTGFDECSGSNGASGGGRMSPNLSIEIIDEEDVPAFATSATASDQRSSQVVLGEAVRMRRPSPATSTTSLDTVGVPSTVGPSSSTALDYVPQNNGGLLKPHKEDFPVTAAQPPDYAPKGAVGGSGMQSASATIGNAGSGTGRATTSGRGRQDGTTSSNSIRSSLAEQRRLAMSSRSTSNHGQISSALPHSKSTLELYPGLEPVTFRKPISRGYSPIRSNHHPPSQSAGYYQQGGSGNSGSSSSSNKMHRSDSAQISSGRQYGTDRHQRSNGAASSHNGNIKVEIVTKPVVRSKTSLDMRHGHERSTNNFHGGPRQPSVVMHSSSASSMPTNGGGHLIKGLSESHPLHENGNGFGDGIGIGSWSATGATDEFELKVLHHEHHTIMQTLKNRNALLVAIRRYTSEGNVIGALKAAVQIPDNQILVDLLGAMLEKTFQWTLDMCVLLLPKLYDMLQSEVKFHCARACDTLRDILPNFLPVIRENTDPLGACTIGVDVSREERQKKCLECKRWLLIIRSLPENLVVVSSFPQLQNMLVDI